MTQSFDQTGEYFKSLSRKQIFWSLSALLLVAAVLVYFKLVRPDVKLIFRSPNVFVVNHGKGDALINRVDGFLFSKGEIAYIGNMPTIQQRVGAGAAPKVLQIGAIPTVETMGLRREPWYLKLIIRYQSPGVPVFRYTSLLYLEISPDSFSWQHVEHIPAKYRALGSAGVGNVNVRRLELR
jgi:hypothetical protein